MVQGRELSPPINVAGFDPGVDFIYGLSLFWVILPLQKLTFPSSNSPWKVSTKSYSADVPLNSHLFTFILFYPPFTLLLDARKQW